MNINKNLKYLIIRQAMILEKLRQVIKKFKLQQLQLIYKKMPKNRLPRDYKPNEIFRIQLSSEQMNYISNVLPFGYSFVLQPKKSLPKYIIQASRRKTNTLSQDSNSVVVNEPKIQQINKKNTKLTISANNKINNDKNILQKNMQNNNNNNKWIQTLNQGVKKCGKILSMLKGHKSSWPFLQPVDALALQIPEYYEIIKQPMDLQTIQSKLKADKYSDFTQFQSDIMKIIQNSYRFNEANEDYLKITSQFESYFTKISTQLSQESTQIKIPQIKNIQPLVTQVNKKKKKSQISNKQFNQLIPLTLLEKKQLVQQIKRLGKQHIKCIKLIIFDHQDQQNDTFDLEKLNLKKLRQLQKFIRNKIINMEQRNRSLINQKNEFTNLNIVDSQQSPFLTSSSGDS